MSVFPVITTGLAAFVSLSWVTIFTAIPEIEADLVERVSKLKEREDLQWVEVSASGQDIVVGGHVPSFHARAQAMTFARQTDGTSEVEDRLTVVGTRGSCQQDIDEMLNREHVRFASASNDIDPSSHFLLKMLAAVALNCDASIEIAGHTDSRGDSQRNLRLSKDRAEAVRQHLIRSGVSEDQITATGYGETQPIYDNATREGRRLNRRIEFRVTGAT